MTPGHDVDGAVEAGRIICDALESRQLLQFQHKDRSIPTVIEPYIYGVNSAGHLAVSGWLVSGQTSEEGPPFWRMYLAADMRDVALAERHFGANRPGFNPNDPHFREIVCRVAAASETVAGDLPTVPSRSRDVAHVPPSTETRMPRNAAPITRGPAALGPYSHAIWAGDLLYISGQTPIDPSTGQLVSGDVGVQTHRVFDNLQAILEDAGLVMDDVIKCNVYLRDMRDFPAMNAAYASRFSTPYPARTTVAVAGLPLDAQVEIELVARRGAPSA